MKKRTVAVVLVVGLVAVGGAFFLFLGGGSATGDGGENDSSGGILSDGGEDDNTSFENESVNDAIGDNENVTLQDLYEDAVIDNLSGHRSEYPDGVTDNNLETDVVISSTLDEMTESSWIHNIRIRDNGSYHGQPYRVVSKYDFVADEHAHFEAYDTQYGQRVYSQGDQALVEHIYGNGTTYQESRTPISTTEQFRPELMRNHIAPGYYTPKNTSVVNGYRTFLLTANEYQNPGQLRDMLDASNIIAYSGAVWVGEDGLITRANIFVLYQDQSGQTRRHNFVHGLATGNVTVGQPNWVDERVLEDSSVPELSLADGRYIRVTPDGEAVPDDSRVVLETNDGTYRTAVPKIEAGETGYLYVSEGELKFGRSKPSEAKTLSRAYSIIISSDGKVILRKDTR